MINLIIRKLIGSKNDREIRKLWPLVARINRLEQEYQALSDEQLRAKTDELKQRLEQARKQRGYYELMEQARRYRAALQSDKAKIERQKAFAIEQAILNELLPEAYAAVKNTCRRLYDRKTVVVVRGHELVWDMIPFDVQLIGAIALHQGKIAEMATGEGKTLVATMPVYLNALAGHGVHVVTVNDYLAQRDAEWMGAVYKFLGLTVGVIVHDQPPHIRRQQYNCDVTYGTNAEFGFDYLRDNGMAQRKEDQVQRGHYYAIVDEVDSILIDEARTPLIISGPAVVSVDNELYNRFKPQVESLVRTQERLCNRFLEQAEDLLKTLHPGDDAPPPENAQELEYEIGRLLYRVKLGQPRSERLLRLLENPAHVKLMQAVELALHADQTKKQLYAEKEELFFAMDEKTHEADLTEKGRNFLSPSDPDAFLLPDLGARYQEIDARTDLNAQQRLELKTKLQQELQTKAQKIHAISQLLKAYCLYQLDVHYVIENGKIVIVDEHTGRPMYGRRWSDGLHQAVEAKEGVQVEEETQTLATITIQNYFRLYQKLAGMTGTAETEAQEFWDIYKLGVLVIPTNKPCIRQDYDDTVYKTKREKFSAVINEIKEIHAQGRPILVGTVAVETSEHLSRLLKREGIVHSVLNAKYHQQEAEIVARAGQRGAVTIATNMAGRGTDIKLGPGVVFEVQCQPHPEKKGEYRYTLTDPRTGEVRLVDSDSPAAGVFRLRPDKKVCGGLHVLGTERHEARRIDRQLRGRCARQGDPGSSHFFISLEDDLMRLFGSDRMVKYMEKMGLEEGQELQHPLLSRSIEQAQKRVEQHNFQIRKRTLEYDDVMNKQREVVYGFRNEIIHGEDVRNRLMDIMEEVVVQKVAEFPSDKPAMDWNVRGLADWVNLTFPISLTEEEIIQIADAATEEPPDSPLFENLSPAQYAVARQIADRVRKAYEIKVRYENPEALQALERFAILSAIDKLWQEHLYDMDHLRTAIGLRSYGQRDPLIEYKSEAFSMFENLMINIKSEICHNIFRSASSLMAFQAFLANLPQQLEHAQASAYGTTTTTSSGGPAAEPRPSDVVSEAVEAVTKAKPVRVGVKVGRNEPCPCGSGKKYKHCCGR